MDVIKKIKPIQDSNDFTDSTVKQTENQQETSNINTKNKRMKIDLPKFDKNQKNTETIAKASKILQKV